LNHLETYKNTAEKYFRVSLFLSLFFHFFFAFFIVTSPPYDTTRHLPNTGFLIEVTLIGQSKMPVKSVVPITAGIKNFISAPAKKLAVKPVSVAKNKRLKKDFIASIPAKKTTLSGSKSGGSATKRINPESLQNDMRSVAENIVFGRSDTASVLPEKTKASSESAYRRYIDACSSKIARIGNTRNKALADGTVVLHVTIEKNGRVSERYVESSPSQNLNTAALEIIDTASPFGPFPKDFLRKNIKFSPRIHFVSR
jgi:TonB family protein